MLRQFLFDNLLFNDGVALFVKFWFSCGFFLDGRFGIVENVEGQALVFSKDLVHEEAVLLVGTQKVYHTVSILVDVRFVVVIIFDGFFGLNKLSNINSRGLCHFFKTVCQVLKLVSQIM